MEYKLDMSMMFAIHDALRRELVQVTRIARVPDDNPGPLLRAAMGWELFKKFLTVHHRPKTTCCGQPCVPRWPRSPTGSPWPTRWKPNTPSSSRC